MRQTFTPITIERAKKLEVGNIEENTQQEQDPHDWSNKIVAWADSREELELMEKMSDEELEAYLLKRDGGRE